MQRRCIKIELKVKMKIENIKQQISNFDFDNKNYDPAKRR